MLTQPDPLTLKVLAQMPDVIVHWLKAERQAVLERLGRCNLDEVLMWRGALRLLDEQISAIENASKNLAALLIRQQAGQQPQSRP